MRHFFTDTATATLQMVGDGVQGDVTPADAETVHLDSPWNDFFGTDEYVKFRATVAQPIVQPYFYDGEVNYFAKDEGELREAQAQLQHTPWTMGHPDDDRVTDSTEIRGFWDEPNYADGQDASLYLPANDTDAVRFAVDNDEVSVGFSGVLDWVDDPTDETPSLTTDSGEEVFADAIQRNMAYDHVASVETGRCPPEKGCGLHTDQVSQNHAERGSADAATTPPTQHGHARLLTDAEHDEMDPSYEEGEWLSWEWQGGEAVGRVENISTSRSLSVGDTTRDPSEEGEPVYKLKHWDEDSFGNMKVAYESKLSSASEPEDFSDSGVRTTRTEEGSVLYQHDESYPYEDDSHRYESKDAAREAAAELGCDGAHKHEGDGETWWMPCGSMDTFDRMVDDEHSYMDACDCPHITTITDVGRECSDGPCRCGLHTFGDAEINGTTVDLTVPDGAQSAADAFLQAKDDGLLGSDCGTGAGTTSAEMIAEGEVTADRLVSKINPYLQRADEYVTREDHPNQWPDEAWQDCGNAQYASWGWTSLRDWAESKAEEVQAAMGDDRADSGVVSNGDSAKRVTESGDTTDSLQRYFTAADGSIMDTISYDGLMRGDLDESEIPNEGYEPHYVFDADTKSDSSYPLVDGDGNLRRGNVGAAFQLYGRADDEELLLDVLAQANERFMEADGFSAPIEPDSLAEARGEDTETDGAHMEETDTNHETMSDGDNGGDGDGGSDPAPSDPTEFYDGEPTVEQLADDFGTVQMLLDDKEELESEVTDLNDELRERKRGEAEDKAAELAEMTDFWGDEDELVEQFADGEITLDDLDEKIEAAESIANNETTTVNDDSDESGSRDSQYVADTAPVNEDREYERTTRGKIDLSSH